MSLVVDTSAIIAWLLRQDKADVAERALADNAGDLAAPAMLWVEVPYVLGKRLARREINLSQRDRHLSRVRRLGVEIDQQSALPGPAFDRMIGLSDQFSLTTYDAAFLEVAIRSGSRLLTFDDSLLRAAAAVGVTTL